MVKPSVIILSFFLFISLNCNNPTQPPVIQNVELKVNDATATEVFLEITTSNINLPVSATLNKDGTLLQNITLVNANTTIVDKSLSPNKNYTYQVIININGKQVTSSSVPAQTMDTTSHNFTWQTFTFGGLAGSSTLYDVAIINENDIWAVGEIYMNDSKGQPDPNAYNAVHWDGSKWELKRIKTNACGGVVYPPIKAIFVFSSNDILFAHIDGSISYYNEIEFINDCSLITQLNGSANKIWGMSRNDFYVVSSNGFIAHYINGYWQKLISGTNLNVNDIWGDFNQATGKYEILAVASNIFSTPDRAILSIDPATRIVTHLSSQPIQYTLKGVWFNSNKQYFVSGDGIFQKHRLSDNSWKNNPLEITNYFINKIRGNDINDVVAVGAFGEVLHYNGVNWKSYRNTTKINDGAYYSVETGNNLVAAVGQDNPAAVLIIGKR